MIRQKETQKSNKATKQSSKSSKMAMLRLQKDLQAYQQQSKQIDFVTLSFPDPQTIQSIDINIFPQENSPYKNTVIRFALKFPDTYPLDPPKLKCLNKLFHPNINFNGSVCLPLLREDWSPTVTLFSIVCGLIFIMTFPNAEDALEPTIGDMMLQDFALYQKIVQHTVLGRMYQSKNYDNIAIEPKNKSAEKEEEDQLDIQC